MLAWAVAVIAIWTAITIGGSMVAAGPDTPLDTLVSSTSMVPVLLAANTLMLVLSEELAFRGMLWSQVREPLSFWAGFLLESVLFGAVHVLNGLWDFLLFFASASDGPVGAAAAAPAAMMGVLATIGIIAVPMSLYALFLLRNARVRGNWREDSPPWSASDEKHSPTQDHR